MLRENHTKFGRRLPTANIAGAPAVSRVSGVPHFGPQGKVCRCFRTPGVTRQVAALRVLGAVLLVAIASIATQSAGAQTTGDLSELLKSGEAPATGAADATNNAGGDAAGELTAPRVDWSHAERVYKLIEIWVERGSVETPAGKKPDAREAILAKPIEVSQVVGLRLTLRYAGYATMGDATVTADDVPAAGNGVVDLVAMARVATQRSLAEAKQAVDKVNASDRQRQIDAGKVNPRPLLSFQDYVRLFQVDLQVGHSAEPVNISADAPENTMYGLFAGGYHGLIMRPNEPGGANAAEGGGLLDGVAGGAAAAATKRESYIWPATAIAANLDQRNQLRSLLAQAGYGPGHLPTIARPDGPRLERFYCIHVVRPVVTVTRPEPMMRLTRGHVVLPRNIDKATIDGLSDRMTAHLSKRLSVKGPMRGRYFPSANVYRPIEAATNEIALTAYALSLRSRVMSKTKRGGLPYTETLSAARAAVTRADEAMFGETTAAPPARAMGLLLLAILESPQFAERKELRSKLTGQILRLQRGDGIFAVAAIADAKPVDQPTQAILFAALASLHAQTRDRTVGSAAALARDAAWQQFRSKPRGSSPYWLAIGEAKLGDVAAPPREAEAGGDVPDGDGEADPPANANVAALPPATRLQRLKGLQDFAKFLLERQIIEQPDSDECPADVVGGFDLQVRERGEPKDIPAPDWHAADALALIAAIMQNGEIIKQDNRGGLLIRCSLAARFIAQLVVDTPNCFYMADPNEALGGVRQALDQNQLDITATATSLIAISQLQETVSEMESGR